MKICLDPKSTLKYQFQLEMAEFTNSFIILLFQIVSLSQGLNTIQTSKEKHHNVRQQLKFFDEKYYLLILNLHWHETGLICMYKSIPKS